jgi:hypothetical protein
MLGEKFYPVIVILFPPPTGPLCGLIEIILI